MVASISACLLVFLPLWQEGKEPEAISLLGQALFPMTLSAERQAHFQAKLEAAKSELNNHPEAVINHIWVGRRTAYLGRFREAIDIFSRAIEQFPRDPRLYRHRGHRYLSILKFSEARRDFERAAMLIEGKEDRVEPDGLPNASGIPTSTLHTNIWYHYGLVCYLQGDFEKALTCYQRCLEASKNNDMKIATLDWTYMTLRRLGRHQEATEVLKPVTAEMEILENHAYHRRILMYKGKMKPEALLRVEDDQDAALNFATQGYGVGNFYLVEGHRQKALDIFEKVVEGKYWSAFGFIAAEADLARFGKKE